MDISRRGLNIGGKSSIACDIFTKRCEIAFAFLGVRSIFARPPSKFRMMEAAVLQTMAKLSASNGKVKEIPDMNPETKFLPYIYNMQPCIHFRVHSHKTIVLRW